MTEDDMMARWVDTGELHRNMPADMREECKRVNAEIRAENREYSRMFRHLTNDHRVPEWSLWNARSLRGVHDACHEKPCGHIHKEHEPEPKLLEDY